MKTAVAWTSVEAYYTGIVAPGVELADAHELMVYILQRWPCTRRSIAEHFRRIDSKHRFAQEARVSARVNWLLKFEIGGKPVLTQSDDAITDPVSGHKAHPLYPTGLGLQRDLFSAAVPHLQEARA
jgi:hypothetical protein